jgi:hypothetical protein
LLGPRIERACREGIEGDDKQLGTLMLPFDVVVAAN